MKNKNDVVVEHIGSIDINDYPDFVDAFIDEAYFKSTNEKLTDAELDELNEDSLFIYESIVDLLY